MQRQNNRNTTNNNTNPQEKAHCYCCVNGLREIDYKDLQLMQKFTSMHHKILSNRKSNLCSKHQRKAAQAIKRSRIMALIPFTNDHK